MIKTGETRKVYSYSDNVIKEHTAVCVGFMSDEERTPVWYMQTFDRKALSTIELYIAFDGGPMYHGYFETPKETLDYMLSLAAMRLVQHGHLIANIELARQKWEEKQGE